VGKHRGGNDEVIGAKRGGLAEGGGKSMARCTSIEEKQFGENTKEGPKNQVSGAAENRQGQRTLNRKNVRMERFISIIKWKLG